MLMTEQESENVNKNDEEIKRTEKEKKKIKKIEKNEKNVKKIKEDEKKKQLKSEIEIKKKNEKKENEMWQFDDMFEDFLLNKFSFSVSLLNENDMKFIDNKLKMIKNNNEDNDENENDRIMIKELKINYNLLMC